MLSCLWDDAYKIISVEDISVWVSNVFLVVLMLVVAQATGPDGAVAKSSDNRLVGTGFATRYRLQQRAGL